MKRMIIIEDVTAIVQGSVVMAPDNVSSVWKYSRNINIRTTNGDEVELHLLSHEAESLRPKVFLREICTLS